ncbi:MAG: hypothetical protein R6X02_29820 [Enhygromyxa sp.]
MGTVFEIIRAALSGPRSRRPVRVDGEQIELETIDILNIDEPTLERVRLDLMRVMAAAYATKAWPDGTIVGPEEYVDRALDRTTFDCFNGVVLAHDREGPVGFIASYVQRKQVLGREVEVIRIGAHVVPSAQSSGLTRISFIILALRYARTRLWIGVPRYFLGLCLNPVSYRFIGRRTRRLYPSPTCPDDPMMVALCGASFPQERRVGDAIAEPRAPRIDARLRASIDASDDPLIRYFVSRCPNYAEGYGLPIAAELGAADFVYALAKHAWLGLTKRRRPS